MPAEEAETVVRRKGRKAPRIVREVRKVSLVSVQSIVYCRVKLPIMETVKLFMFSCSCCQA
jgi:hypothetical protein